MQLETVHQEEERTNSDVTEVDNNRIELGFTEVEAPDVQMSNTLSSPGKDKLPRMYCTYLLVLVTASYAASGKSMQCTLHRATWGF